MFEAELPFSSVISIVHSNSAASDLGAQTIAANNRRVNLNQTIEDKTAENKRTMVAIPKQ